MMLESLTALLRHADGLSATAFEMKKAWNQKFCNKKEAEHRRTGGLGMLTPDTETPEVPQTTVSPNLL